MEINIGINKNDREAIAQGLSKLLADSYLLYLKVHNFHWNVVGPQFHSLHKMFEEQYLDLAQAVDVIAERIRTLGEFAPGSFDAYHKLSTINEETGHPKANDMVKQLVTDHETLVSVAREVFATAEKASDQPTVDLLTHRMTVHEKEAWMLRSLLETG